MAAVQLEDDTPDRVVIGQAHPVPTGRSVINYIGQLHHTPNHHRRRPGLPAPDLYLGFITSRVCAGVLGHLKSAAWGVD